MLGEVHDNAAHHTHQVRAVKAIQPAAIVFEMLTPEQAEVANDLVGAAAGELAEALNWADTGWPDFNMYYPIFTTSSARIYGGALPRQNVRRAISEGAAALFGDGAERYGLTTPLPEDQRETREAAQMTAHCDALPPEMLPGMVEAQRLRDAAIAQAVVEAFQATGGPVVVITGNGHARSDWGVPHNLRVAAPDLTLLSIGQFEETPDPGEPFDLWLVTDPTEREDPCAAFQ
ncbi:hypothetical protein GCM10011517_01760 [Actibacterium pelagium]|uniref:Haem-binding uptake Tiki superfamily ChaN domain-containing protein n=1 Tax=Actibacterium pelagium TaxID=2029103 RepID=A0A917A9Q5_9RHOB|nr:hypothetical protein GCM10011517_01760 [Actibacterium pelagium]